MKLMRTKQLALTSQTFGTLNEVVLVNQPFVIQSDPKLRENIFFSVPQLSLSRVCRRVNQKPSTRLMVFKCDFRISLCHFGEERWRKKTRKKEKLCHCLAGNLCPHFVFNFYYERKATKKKECEAPRGEEKLLIILFTASRLPSNLER